MSKKRILIVDDDVTATRLLKLGLEKTGDYEVREENSSLQGLAVAQQFHPDLILLDIVMPHIDGGDLAARIEADRTLKGTPVVFLTSLISEQEELEGHVQRGGHRFLAKPVQAPKVIRCIEEELGSRANPLAVAAPVLGD